MITTMTTPSGGPISRFEVITFVQRRRRWSAAEKVRLVEEAMQPGMSVSFVARRAGIAPQLFAWKRRMIEGGHAAVQADEDVVGTSRVRELEKRVRDLERLLGRKTMENEILKEAIVVARLKKTDLAAGVLELIGRTVRDEDRGQYAGCRPIQSDRTARQGDPAHAESASSATRPIREWRRCPRATPPVRRHRRPRARFR